VDGRTFEASFIRSTLKFCEQFLHVFAKTTPYAIIFQTSVPKDHTVTLIDVVFKCHKTCPVGNR